MSFSLVTSLGIVLCGLFGLVGLLAPEQLLAFYGISGWNAGTLLIARLWGVLFILLAANLASVRKCTDRELQSRFAKYSAVTNALAAAVVAQGVLVGSANSLLWSSVALFAFFSVAFGNIGLRR